MQKVVLLVLLGVLLGACGPTTAVLSQQVDDLTVSLEMPAQPRMLSNYDFVVTLKDAAGQPVSGALVWLQIDMPNMPMGTNRIPAEERSPGRYAVPGVVFTMTGDWEVVINTTASGKVYEARFPRLIEQ